MEDNMGLVTPAIQHEPEALTRILHPIVRQWFFKRFPSYSLPQLHGVLPIHQRQNILISAPTGATKTLTAFLGILNELVDSSQQGILEPRVYAIYVSPLKALNRDIRHNLITPLLEMEEQAGRKLGIRVAVRTGDTTPAERAKMLAHPPHILITTPESLAIMLASPKFSEKLHKAEWLIVDEIHALAENKRGVDLSLSMERLQRLAPALCRVGLSATVAPLEDVAGFLAGSGRPCIIADITITKRMELKVLSPSPDLIDTSYPLLHRRLYDLLDTLIQQHKTTLIFTNTRSATERVVHTLKQRYPARYTGENIAAHHGSLSKLLRHATEERLRKGELRAVVCSTSLELGIDIGAIDLVICLGSPKSVARFLQRAGRSGHKLHETVKGRIVVMDRDDLVECAVLLKSALERKIDRLHIPRNCLDVLAQHVFGMAIEQVWEEKDLYGLVRKSWCYRDLPRTDFTEVLSYLAGEYAGLEDRRVYAKIWREDGRLGRRGRLARPIYMANAGTIPEETFITVKIGNEVIGHLDENFLERLRQGDTFVLGGETYEFQFSRGMVAQVRSSVDRPPSVPSWVSEMLPLSYDLAREIGRFRRLMQEKLTAGKPRQEVVRWLQEFLPVDENAANALYEYCREQHDYCAAFPTDKRIIVEHSQDERGRRVIVHSLLGRRVNDCLSRALAFVLGKLEHCNVELGLNDNGFVVSAPRGMSRVGEALKLVKPDKLGMVMTAAVERSEIFKRRFRHCATRALMILRSYMGHHKRVGRQQVASTILLPTIRSINPDFCILREARRECLEDLMDITNAKAVLQDIQDGKITIQEVTTDIPSPFGLNIALQGTLDVLRMEDRIEFLRKMHQYILARIGQKAVTAEPASKEAVPYDF
jgi:ATP-dependent Lhr-like helicase